MKDHRQPCSCGRPAEWLQDRTEIPQCFELIHGKPNWVWQLKYPNDKEPRHKE